MDKVTLIRSLRHEMKNHNSAGYYSLTGYAPPTDDQRLRDSHDLFPAYGSIVDALAPARAGVPTFVSYPYVIADGSITPGQHASFLGKAHDPLFINQDPNAPDFRLPELSLPDNLTPDRLANRRDMMRLIDEQSALLEFSARARGIDETYDKARDHAAVRPASSRRSTCRPSRRRCATATAARLTARAACWPVGWSRRGRGSLTSTSRRSSAAARAAGTRTASTINRCTRSSKTSFCRSPTKRCRRCWRTWTTAACLNETLVVWVGEFGRSPRINSMAGRDHWPQCYTALLAGGGVKRGFVYGASDKTGAYPASDPARPEDLSATMFHLLGIDPKTQIRDALHRPLPISTGSVIEGVLA